MELNERFRGYLPIVIDLETGGFNVDENPLLELACTFLNWTAEDATLSVGETHAWDVEPFSGSSVDPASLKVTGIDLSSDARDAIDEKEALTGFFKLVRAQMKVSGCHRAVMVAHNASFDASFLNQAVHRAGLKRNPFHPFTTIDTAALGAVAYGHTVLSEICRRAEIEFQHVEAHSASYDAERTAQVFCNIVNRWPLEVSGW